MKIFKIEHGYTVIKDIEGDLKSMQEEVGGYITLAPHFDELTERKIDIYADDEALLKENPIPSLFVLKEEDPEQIESILFGNLIFTGYDSEGNSLGLTQDQIEFITDHITEVTYCDAEGRSGRAFTFIFTKK